MESDGQQPFSPGDHFGDYTVERMLGKGSMGTVYLMRSPDGSPFAVKIMHRGRMSPDMRTRFAREAEATMGVRHKNLISVYDAGEDPDTGLCYIIMDYVPGGTLADRIRECGKIPVGDAVKIAMHIAVALDAVHKGGLVHRDVKPDNIMFAADGTPKLADLGVAKFGDDRSTMVTMTGMVIGTPAYMSPEQLMDSHNIDARSDIYSLGVILYEMLAGKRPNSGSTAVELLAKAIKGEALPDIRTMSPEISAAIAHALSLMCAPKPDNRPATSIEAAQLLRNAVTGKLALPKKPPRAVDAKARKSKHWIPVAAGIVSVSLLSVAAIFFMSERPSSGTSINTVVTSIVQQVTGGPVRSDKGEMPSANDGYQKLKAEIDAERAKSPPVTKEDFKLQPAGAVVCDAKDGKVVDLPSRKDADASESEKKQAEPQPDKEGQIVLIPRLDRNPKAWTYSFEDWQGWKTPDFDDSKWKRAQGGFGRRESFGQLPHAHINTTWDSERIFLRKRFNWSGVVVSRVVADAYQDDEADLYLNGEFLLTINGANFDWQPFEIPVERFAKALRSGENVFCVEVRNSGGHCQYFDCGLVVECGGTPAAHAGPDCIRKIKTDVGTWTVMVKDGIAQIGDGRNVALDPHPKGALKIPLELDGLKIRRLASNCFKTCDRLEDVIIPEGVHSVGAAAFFNCRRLSKMTVPETLEHFGWEALHGTGLKHIDLKNTRLIEGSVFKFCERLDKVSVSHSNLTFAVRDGVLYDRVRRAVVFCPRSKKSCAIPVGIEEIYDSAFFQCMIKSIEIPETVIGVWDCAFEACPLLGSVRFKGDDVILGGWAFGNTPSLKSIVLPSRQKSLDAQAIFRKAGKLESVRLPDTVETIGVGVFEDCSRLKTINLGKSLRLVRYRAFCRCPQLREIEFPKTLKELEAEVFRDCKSLNSVVFRDNAPTLSDRDGCSGDDIYNGANPSLTTFVPEGSTGWSIVSQKLPKEWPEAAGEYARPIRFASKRGRTRK